MNKDEYTAIKAARDAASTEHQPAIRWAMNRIDRLEKRLQEIFALASVIRRSASTRQDEDES